MSLLPVSADGVESRVNTMHCVPVSPNILGNIRDTINEGRFTCGFVHETDKQHDIPSDLNVARHSLSHNSPRSPAVVALPPSKTHAILEEDRQREESTSNT